MDKRSFEYSVAHVWNELDNKYKQGLELECFSVMIKYVERLHM